MFLDLPRELRDKIYWNIFKICENADTWLVVDNLCSGFRINVRTSDDEVLSLLSGDDLFGLFLVNKQIHREASQAFYHHNQFEISSHIPSPRKRLPGISRLPVALRRIFSEHRVRNLKQDPRSLIRNGRTWAPAGTIFLDIPLLNFLERLSAPSPHTSRVSYLRNLRINYDGDSRASKAWWNAFKLLHGQATSLKVLEMDIQETSILSREKYQSVQEFPGFHALRCVRVVTLNLYGDFKCAVEFLAPMTSGGRRLQLAEDQSLKRMGDMLLAFPAVKRVKLSTPPILKKRMAACKEVKVAQVASE